MSFAHRPLSTVLISLLATHAMCMAEPQESQDTRTREEILEETRALRERLEALEKEVQQLEPPAGDTAPPAFDPAPPKEGSTAAGAPMTKDELPLTAGYDKNAVNGFFIRDPEGEFRLNIGAYTQVRYTMNWRTAEAGTGDDFTRNASVNRTRFFFEGQFTDPLKYHFRLNLDDAGDIDIIAAYFQWQFAPDWSLRLGEQFMALSREDWMYGQDVLGPEFSTTDFTFAIGSSIGAQVHYAKGRHRVWAGISNGAFGGKSTFASLDVADIAFTGRYEYQLSGTDWSVWDDLVGRRGRAEGMLLGLAGAYQINQKESSTSVDAGAEVIADLSFNGDGYQAMIAGTLLLVDPQDGDWYNNYGVHVQGGYFFTDKLQLYGRYELLAPGDEPGDLEIFNSIAVGLNFFPFVRTNRWKFTAEAQYLFEALNRTIVSPSEALAWLAADEDGQFAIRLQAQLGF